jgi:hypothetical protein
MKKAILFLILVFAMSSTKSYAQKNSKPNILFIAIDDLKPELGAYGNKLVKTPNIDRLAKMSTVFMSNYCYFHYFYHSLLWIHKNFVQKSQMKKSKR